MRIQDKYSVVLFDGVCNLCNNAVDFIIRNDKNDNFKVGALQDDAVKNILEDYKVNKDYLDSLVLIEGDEIYFKSTAALKIAKKIGGFWKIVYVGIILPASWRDSIYDWIAKNRYKWYGKKETCRLPTPEEKAKFL